MTFEVNLNVQAETTDELLHRLKALNEDVLAWFQGDPDLMDRTCKKCHRIQRLSYSIRNELWALLPEEWQRGTLCLECYLEILEEELEDIQEFKVDDFLGLWVVGVQVAGTLVEFPDCATDPVD